MTKQGPLYPSLHNLISKWSPPNERGKFISALLGGTFGPVVTWPVSGLLVEHFGWTFAFYVPAIVTAIVTFLWCLIVFDSPSQHPRISSTERQYIESSLGDAVKKTKVSQILIRKTLSTIIIRLVEFVIFFFFLQKMPPFGELLTSLPFYALLLLHYGNLWGLYFLVTAAPKFMSEVLGFNLAKAGILASLPYLARFFAGFVFGSIGDVIRQKQIMSVTAIRKFFTIFCKLFSMYFTYHSPIDCSQF